MQNLYLKPVTPDDFPTILHLHNQVSPQKLSLEQFLEREHSRPNTEQFLERLIALESHNPVGMVSLVTSGFIRQQWAQINLVVSPEARGKGYGSAIWQKFRQCLDQHLLSGVEVHIDDSDPNARIFAEKSGFEFYAHRFSSQLNLLEFDATAFQADLEKPLQHGYQLEPFTKSLEWERLYNFFATSLSRAPDMQGLPRWTEQQVKEMLFDHPEASPEWIWLARANQRWAGIAVLLRRTQGQTYNFFTGVEPEARGHGLAIALKLCVIAVAKNAGFSQMRTNNLSTNAPMLAINRKLGFQVKSGRWLMQMPL
jgi:GNAT superfamily N-acetyltransferase